MKVTLPKEVAEAIEQLRREGHDTANIVYTFASGENYDNVIAKTLADYASDNFDAFLQALVNGYEVEETPEDKVREYFNNLKASCNWSATGAIENVFDMLNIKIEGVNT